MEDHTERVARAALEMAPALSRIARDQDLPLDIRIGIHRGPVVAGVIGRHKFIYDLWGDTVNIASRMESQGLANYIQCTDAVHDALPSGFLFEARGPVDIKGKGPMPTWLLRGVC
jgi:adenylate cyclase